MCRWAAFVQQKMYIKAASRVFSLQCRFLSPYDCSIILLLRKQRYFDWSSATDHRHVVTSVEPLSDLSG